MDIKNVPQDHISTYAENKKAVYATDENGLYTVVSSSGWDVEEEVTKQALIELQRQADDAYQLVVLGSKSPLYYHMYAQRMDLIVLAQSTGMFQWRIKRHFKPAVFNSLSASLLNRYSDALGVSVDNLKKLPELKEK
jgi:GTPase SAR1 family protein